MATATPPHHRNGIVMNARLDEGIRVEIMTITPDQAAKWLKRNHTNRPIKRQHLARLVRTLQAGRWQDVNGETIVMSDDSHLLDGQHRLLAVHESGIAITTLVVFGVKAQQRGSIDTGVARGLGDHLGLHGHTNTNSLAAALTLLKGLEQNVAISSGFKAVQLFATHDEALEYLAQFPGLIESVRHVKKFPTLMRPAQAAVLDYHFAQKDAAVYHAWHCTMETGRLVEPYDTFLFLRERLIRDRSEKVQRPLLEPYVYNVRAWNAVRRGESLKKFVWRTDEAVPVIA